jgi:hypothetical protein
MTPQPLTAQAFNEALAALGWKGADFCARSGLVANTVWRWRKGLVPVPLWVGEYLRAILALQRLHAEFVAVKRGPSASGKGEADAPDSGPALDGQRAGDAGTVTGTAETEITET